MIHGKQLCLVGACPACQGTGEVARVSAASSLPIGYGAMPARAPCSQCTNGFVFSALEEVDLLRHLIRLLAGDIQLVAETEYTKKVELGKLREELRVIIVRASEEKILGSA